MHLLISQASRRSVLIFLGTSLAASCTTVRSSARPLNLAEVIRRNTEARGGAVALDHQHSLSIDVEIVEGGKTLNGQYAASKDSFVRIDIYADGKNVFAEGVDRSGGWIWTGSGSAKPGSDSGRAALLNGAENHLYGWNRFEERRHKLALMPPASIEGVSYSVVEARYATGQTSYFYIDPVSWQAVRRRDERAYHPDVDPTKKKVESRFFDFVDVGGVIASHRSEDVDLATGSTLATNRVLARRVNPDLPPDYFDRARRAPPNW